MLYDVLCGTRRGAASSARGDGRCRTDNDRDTKRNMQDRADGGDTLKLPKHEANNTRAREQVSKRASEQESEMLMKGRARVKYANHRWPIRRKRVAEIGSKSRRIGQKRQRFPVTFWVATLFYHPSQSTPTTTAIAFSSLPTSHSLLAHFLPFLCCVVYSCGSFVGAVVVVAWLGCLSSICCSLLLLCRFVGDCLFAWWFVCLLVVGRIPCASSVILLRSVLFQA
jgi:hypothetical protein